MKFTPFKDYISFHSLNNFLYYAFNEQLSHALETAPTF